MYCIEETKRYAFCLYVCDYVRAFVTALYITIFWPHVMLGVEILWQILSVSFLCSVVNSIYPQREISGKAMLILYILRYVITNGMCWGVVYGLGGFMQIICQWCWRCSFLLL